MSITDTFIDGLVAMTRAFPQSVSQQARYCLLDYIGIKEGGKRYLSEKSPRLRRASHSEVFFNAFSAHVLELDDGHRHGMIHLGASIISALLEVANREQFSSSQLLKGIVMGYEAALRCAKALQPGHKMRGYHVSGTCGTIGAAMGIAFALDYDITQLRSTLSCAVTSASGLLEIQEQSSELKPFNVGCAAMNGVVAAQIGRLGIPGPDDILGGKRGFLAALTDTPHKEALTDFGGEGYAIEGIYQKVYAACRHCHPAIDAAMAIRNEIGLKPEQVEKIEVHTYKLAVGSHDHTDIKGVSSAKLSTPFAVALAIVKGSAGYADYTEENLENRWIKSLTRRVVVIEDKDLTDRSPAVRGARLIINLKDGKSYESVCLYPKGEPENPLSQQELEEKFRSLAVYGGLSSEECDEIIREIWKERFDVNKILQIVFK